MSSFFSAVARRTLATLVILGCLATLTVVAMVAARYLHWNWAAWILAAGTVVLSVVGLRLMLDALDQWVEGPENDGSRGPAWPRPYTKRRDV